MSRNPFRQARDNNEEIKATDNAASLFDNITASTGFPASYGEPPVSKKKPKKKVVIKTPPRSPEDRPRRLSFDRPLASPLPAGLLALREEDKDDSDSTGTADSDLEQALINTRGNSAGREPLTQSALSAMTGQAPANPFARTLATTEGQYGQQEEEVVKEGKPAFDVDTFKNILLNGAAPPARQAQADAQPRPDEAAIRFPDISTGSLSQTPDAASPTLSDSSSDDESPEELLPSASARQAMAKSAPETVSFSDFDLEQTRSLSTIPSVADLTQEPDPLSRQDPDLEKPLPAAPISATKEVSTMPPPPPPTTRRQGAHKEGQSSHRRSSSVISRSSMQSDTSATSEIKDIKAPPPPPSRRAAPGRAPASADSLGDKQAMSPPPAPAPRRAPSKATPPAVRRTPSTASGSSLQALPEGPPTPSSAPKPPPPRRKVDSNRSSVDGNALTRQTSGQDSRRTSNDPNAEVSMQEITRDTLLSDLAALQKEVDELRAKAGG